MVPPLYEVSKYNNSITKEQIEEALKTLENVIAKPGECRTGKVVKIIVNGTPYALKLPCQQSNGPELDTIIYELKNESRVYKRLKLLYEHFYFMNYFSIKN